MPTPDKPKPTVVRGWVAVNPDGSPHRNKYSGWIIFFPMKRCLKKWAGAYTVVPATLTIEPKARKRK